MATNKQAATIGSSKIAGSSSQQTNPQFDPQQQAEMLRAYVQQDITNGILQMQPQIDLQISVLVEQAKEKIFKEIADSKSELQNVKNSVLGAVAVFAAFFTFVSVNVNIFSKTNAVESMALMIIMWICLMGFSYTFFLFLWDKWRTFAYWLPVVIGMAITCGILWWVKPATLPLGHTSTLEHSTSSLA